MSSANGDKFVTNRDLERELRSFRWEVRCLVLAAIVLGNILPVSPADLAQALPF